MSSKQVRKLQARTAAANGGPSAGGAAAPVAETPEADGSDEDEPGTASPAPRRPGFAALLEDSDASAGSDEGENGEASVAKSVAVPALQVSEPKTAKGKKQKKKKKAAKGGSAPAADAASDASDDDKLLERLAAATAGAGAGAGGSAEQVASVLTMTAADFSAEAERRRATAGPRGAGAAGAAAKAAATRGMAVRARGAKEGLTAHHRRLLLVEPSKEEPWPRPEGCAEMVLGEDSEGAPAFDVRSTAAHERLRAEFAMVQASQDLEELQYFVREHPFCVEALLALADVCRGGGEHEMAFQLTRRAVYAVECGFAPGFTPLRETGLGQTPRRPRVALQLPPKDEPSWPGWSWVAALFTYMIGLQRQGLSRTAVEVCKLLLAMLLPRDPLHLLVHLDLLCLAAGQYRLLEQLNLHLLPQHAPCEGGALSALELVLPNFAYSLALARQLAAGGPPDLAALNLVTVAAVAPVLEGGGGGREAGDEEEEARLAPHAALMRALLLFPQVVRPLLEAAGARADAPAPAASPCRKTWQDLLTLPPFAEAGSCRHKRHFLAHALVADAYVRHCARRWLSEALLLPWLHACAGRLTQMCESSLFHGELAAARRAWSEAPLAIGPALAGDYAAFSASEVGPDWQLPRALLQAAAEASALALPRPGLPADAEVGAEDEAVQLERAMRASLAAEAARQRRDLVAEQDAEYERSLAADRAREAGLEPPPEGGGGGGDGAGAAAVDEELVAQLVDMGFEASAARKALGAAGGSLEAALDRLAS